MSKLDALYEYQVSELKKEAFEKEIRNTPARANLKRLHGFLIEQQNVIANLQSEITKMQQALERQADQIEALGKDIELEQSEYEQMQKDEECTAEEMTECRQNYEKLLSELNASKKELNALLGALEGTSKEYKATRQKAGKAKKDYDAMRAVCESEVEAAKGRLAELEQELEDYAKRVEPALLERYKRVKRNHAVPIAKVEHEQCGGCNMSLPMVVIKKALTSGSVVECDNCGRILYVKE